jgi:hypothetical protein
MLSPSAFKDELEKYLAGMKPPEKPGDRGPLGIGSRNSADIAHINRWIDDDRREDVWRELAAIPAPELIKMNLVTRRTAQAKANRIYGVRWGPGERGNAMSAGPNGSGKPRSGSPVRSDRGRTLSPPPSFGNAPQSKRAADLVTYLITSRNSLKRKVSKPPACECCS